MAAGKRETYAWKRFFSVVFGEKPPVISWLVSSQQLCKRFVAPASGSPALPHTAVPQKCAAVVFAEVWRVDKCQSTKSLLVIAWSLPVSCSAWR